MIAGDSKLRPVMVVPQNWEKTIMKETLETRKQWTLFYQEPCSIKNIILDCHTEHNFSIKEKRAILPVEPISLKEKYNIGI